MLDSYRSENAICVHEYLVLIYYAGTPMRMLRVEADCYSDAVQSAAPGNDAVKIEVIGI